VQAQLTVPPLRARRDDDSRYEDVLVLTEHFIKKYGSSAPNRQNSLPTLSAETEHILLRYPFPANVRELEHVITLALSRVDGDQLLPDHFPPRMQRYDVGTNFGVGVNTEAKPLLCPHGSFVCNLTKGIEADYYSRTGVFLRLSEKIPEALKASLRKRVEQLGMTVSPPKNIENALTPMCGICVPIQSSHHAILDLTDATPQVFYELGLVHALGIPVLILRHAESKLPNRFNSTRVNPYNELNEIEEIVEKWLSQFSYYR
jgi:hypothetical protein